MRGSWPGVGRAIVVALAGAASLLAGCGEPSPDPSPSPPPDEVVARVNGAPITASQLERAVAVEGFLGGEKTDDEVLEDLVGEELVAQEAARRGLEVSDSAVEARFDEVAESVGGRDELAGRLKEAGLDEADLRATLRTVLTGELLQDELFSEVKATRAQARRLYDEERDVFTEPAAVRLGDIAVRTEPIAESVLRRIEEGQSFGSAARQFSADPELQASEGMLGWVTLDSIPEPAREVVAGLRAGELSRPVEVGPLWHLFKVFERRPRTVVPFDDVAGQLEEELTRRRRAAALAEWVEEERRTAEVEIETGVAEPTAGPTVEPSP